ncbi:MAG: hypothetical protein QOE90_1251 [Thermoplasmata archaeon]|nr:hypothetical protein [Thermoplasmata archaeon]
MTLPAHLRAQTKAIASVAKKDPVRAYAELVAWSATLLLEDRIRLSGWWRYHGGIQSEKIVPAGLSQEALLEGITEDEKLRVLTRVVDLHDPDCSPWAATMLARAARPEDVPTVAASLVGLVKAGGDTMGPTAIACLTWLHQTRPLVIESMQVDLWDADSRRCQAAAWALLRRGVGRARFPFHLGRFRELLDAADKAQLAGLLRGSPFLHGWEDPTTPESEAFAAFFQEIAEGRGQYDPRAQAAGTWCAETISHFFDVGAGPEVIAPLVAAHEAMRRARGLPQTAPSPPPFLARMVTPGTIVAERRARLDEDRAWIDRAPWNPVPWSSYFRRVHEFVLFARRHAPEEVAPALREAMEVARRVDKGEFRFRGGDLVDRVREDAARYGIL